MKPRHWPWSFLVFAALGALSFGVGLLALAGVLAEWHPLWRDGTAAGIALIVTAIALWLTGAFPLVLRRLAEREGA